MKKHKDGTTKDQMIFDGWSRGFSVSQVASEVEAQGYESDYAEIQVEFDKHQAEMEEFYQRRNNKTHRDRG